MEAIIDVIVQLIHQMWKNDKEKKIPLIRKYELSFAAVICTTQSVFVKIPTPKSLNQMHCIIIPVQTLISKNIAPTFNCRYLVQMYRKIQQYKFLKHFLARFILFILLSTIVQFCATFQCCPIFEFCPIFRILFILLPLPD